MKLKKKGLLSILLGLTLVLGMILAMNTITYAEDETIYYPVWVGGIQVTSLNQDDVLGDADEGATVCFTPPAADEEQAPGTLTLSGAKILDKAEYGTDKNSYTANIHAEGIGLVIELEGKNSIGSLKDPAKYAIDTNKDLEFAGDGALNITGSDSAVSMESIDGTIKVSDGQIIALSISQSTFFSFNTVEIIGGSVIAATTSTSGAAITAGKDIEVSGGTLDATGIDDAICTYEGDITISGGTVEAIGIKGAGIRSEEGDVIAISGGTVNAYGKVDGICNSYGDVEISGGTVTATGKDDGIYAVGNVTIEEGTVTASAEGNDAFAGIDACVNIMIKGGTVTATSPANGIITEYDGDITISGGTVKAYGDEDGIFAGEGNVTITDGNVDTYGGSGCGICGNQITIGKDVSSLLSKGALTAFGGFDNGSESYTETSVKNAVAGTGWMNMEGTGAWTDIEISDKGQDLMFNRVQFPGVEPVQEVTRQIRAIPGLTKIRTSHKKQIEGAREAYDMLTADQRKEIKNAHLRKLRRSEKVLAGVERSEARKGKRKEAEEQADKKYKEIRKKATADTEKAKEDIKEKIEPVKEKAEEAEPVIDGVAESVKNVAEKSKDAASKIGATAVRLAKQAVSIIGRWIRR